MTDNYKEWMGYGDRSADYKDFLDEAEDDGRARTKVH